MSFHRTFGGLAVALALCLSSAAAMAADLPRRVAASAPAYFATPVFSWEGAYVGVHAGYAFAGQAANTHENENFFGFPGGGYGGDVRGVTYGAHAGYNMQVGSLVFGAEIAGSKSNANGQDNYPQYFNDTGTDLRWYVTGKGRIGYAFDRLLIFGTGGYAGGSIGLTQSYAPPVEFGGVRSWSSNAYHHGWTLGAGASFAMTNNVILTGEYEYLNFGRKTHAALDSAGVPANISSKLDAHVVKAGLSFKF